MIYIQFKNLFLSVFVRTIKNKQSWIKPDVAELFFFAGFVVAVQMNINSNSQTTGQQQQIAHRDDAESSTIAREVYHPFSSVDGS